jgi:hypothetical protein
MHGIGVIVAHNSTAAAAVRALAENKFREFARRVGDHFDAKYTGLEPAPIIWGGNLIAISWHQANGFIKIIDVVDRRRAKKLLKLLPGLPEAGESPVRREKPDWMGPAS